jgi:glycine/D-amino acid oxidase-like deaminating enzyme
MARHSNFWFDTFPAEHRLHSGVPTNADVVIIGGGILGISTLLHLLDQDKNLSVILLDECGIAEHASGRSSGQLMIRTGRPFSEMNPVDAKDYIQFLERNVLVTQRIIERAEIDCGLVRSGGLRLSMNSVEDEELDEETKTLSKYLRRTIPVRLNRDEVSTLMPSRLFQGGTFIPVEGTFNPYALVNSLASKAEHAGRRILTGCQVEKVSQSGGNLRVRVRHKGVINARHVVYCLNAYSDELLPEVKSFFTPFRGQMIVTDELPDIIQHSIPKMSMSCNGCSEYFRLYQKRLLVGGLRHAIRGQQEGIRLDGEFSPKLYDQLRGLAFKVFPFLDTKITNVWTGIMCKTRDGLPLVGPRPNHPNEWIAAGFNGYGMSHGFLTGKIIAEYVTKGRTSYDVGRLFDPHRVVEQGE